MKRRRTPIFQALVAIERATTNDRRRIADGAIDCGARPEVMVLWGGHAVGKATNVRRSVSTILATIQLTDAPRALRRAIRRGELYAGAHFGGVTWEYVGEEPIVATITRAHLIGVSFWPIEQSPWGVAARIQVPLR